MQRAGYESFHIGGEGLQESLPGTMNNGSDIKGVDCSICTEKRATAFCGSVAKHGLCRTCLHDYITGTLGDRTVFLELIVCPQLGCGAYMAREDASFVLSGKEVVMIMKRAEESDKLVAKAVRDDEQSLQVMDRTTNRCPRCRVPIEKASGCRHVRCTMCNTSFWFGCNCVYPGPCPHGTYSQTVSGDELEAFNTTGIPALKPMPGVPSGGFGVDVHNERRLRGLEMNMRVFLAEREVLPAVRTEVERLLQTLMAHPEQMNDLDARFKRYEIEHFKGVVRYPPARGPTPNLYRSLETCEPRRGRHRVVYTCLGISLSSLYEILVRILLVFLAAVVYYHIKTWNDDPLQGLRPHLPITAERAEGRIRIE